MRARGRYRVLRSRRAPSNALTTANSPSPREPERGSSGLAEHPDLTGGGTEGTAEALADGAAVGAADAVAGVDEGDGDDEGAAGATGAALAMLSSLVRSAAMSLAVVLLHKLTETAPESSDAYTT